MHDDLQATPLSMGDRQNRVASAHLISFATSIRKRSGAGVIVSSYSQETAKRTELETRGWKLLALWTWGRPDVRSGCWDEILTNGVAYEFGD